MPSMVSVLYVEIQQLTRRLQRIVIPEISGSVEVHTAETGEWVHGFISCASQLLLPLPALRFH